MKVPRYWEHADLVAEFIDDGRDLFGHSHAIRNYKAALRRDPCAYCGRLTVVLDHITSQGRGGANVWGNLTASCWSCNSGKGGRSVLAFLGARFYRADFQRLTETLSRWSKVGA